MGKKNKKVLVAPLNWGLGHATRCIPVIRELKLQGADVVIASDGLALTLLKQEFPELPCLELPSYNIRYASGLLLPVKILMQVPAIIKAVYLENHAIKKIIKDHHIGLIISDNRYGLYNNTVTTVFITHQLFIRPAKGFEWTRKIIDKINFYMIGKFNYCWIPDMEDRNNLSGSLSHGRHCPFPTEFIGPLSRFSQRNEAENLNIKYDLAIVLSGPEPQRSIFEKIILSQLGTIAGNILLVRGTAIESKEVNSKGTLTVVNHLMANEMEAALRVSSLVLCRSGYSGIMDLARLGKKAILVPTPGQTEQEYLAGYFMERKIFFSMTQGSLDIKEAMVVSRSYGGLAYPIQSHMEEAIRMILKSVRKD